jgi:integrase
VTALAEHAARYVAVRRAVGYKMGDTAAILDTLVGYAQGAGASQLSIELILSWAAGAGSDSVYLRRLSVARRFASWLKAFEPATEIPPAGLGPKQQYRRPPYPFSSGEVAALMTQATCLQPVWWASSVTTAIGLAAACGLRPTELYRLRMDDVDVVAGQLAVLDSKGGRSRQLPLHPTTTEALRQHLRLRQAAPARSDTLLVTATGLALSSAVFSPVFRRLLKTVGIAPPEGGRAPRLGDLRHFFAVATLTGWHQERADVRRQLPVLSAFLGHQSPANTYWYLEAVPELMAVVARRVAHTWQAQP